MFKLNHIFQRTPAFIAGVLFVFCTSNISFGQQSVSQDVTSHDFKIYDANGKLFVNPYNDIAGSPFFLDNWKYGKIKVGNNNVFSNVRLKLDLLSQQVHYLNEENIEMLLPPSGVKEITLVDSSKNVPVVYFLLSGFPPVDNQDEKNFYLVLCDGKIRFLESLRKVVNVDKNEYEGTVQKEFREYEDYYFADKGKLVRLKRDKSFVTDFMKDKSTQIESYLQANKVSFKSMDDVKKLVDYYNSL